MPILTKSGRVVIAESIAARPLHLAWGTGDGAWMTPPSEDANATALEHEVGRREATEVAYVVADPAGDILLPTGTYRRSVTPTNNLYVRTNFDFADASSSVIREIGLFVGTLPIAGLPAGQSYFLPAQVSAPGRLLHLENLQPIYRSSAIRESFEIVVTF
jgi:hypothetical protein